MRSLFIAATILSTAFTTVAASAEAVPEQRQELVGTGFQGWTPLMAAIMGGNRELAKNLIIAGADVNNGGAAGEPPLYMAAGRPGMFEVVRLLVEHGADVNQKCRHNLTALHNASSQSSVKVVEYLLSKGADPSAAEDTSGYTPMHEAASSGWNPGRKEVIQLLMARGADINVRDKEGRTALDVATEENHASLIKAIKSLGGKPGKEVSSSTKPAEPADPPKAEHQAPSTAPGG